MYGTIYSPCDTVYTAMSNEGEYLEMCNELRDMYNAMKESLQKEISYCKEQIAYLKEENGHVPKLKFVTNQFDSDRPLVNQGKYVHTVPLQLYYCRRCQKHHPHSYVCIL